ncbi:BatD family protein [Bosea sp. WAO]|uniref:BatD family protein n=1 Tax=Bosea sp. WAO TaxID=406341 RepID=UPI000830E3A6|nr:BatD family protein [Bosea sp. WAO]
MRWLVALLALVIPAAAMAQQPASPPLMRTRVAPAEGVVIGQPVQLNVDVLFPGEMPHPPLVRVPEAAGAQILRFETQATTMRDRISDQDYVGQSFEFTVFPRRGGQIAIPAPEVTLLDRSGDPAGSAKGEATRIDVGIPAGLDASGPVLAADKVTASESWAPDPGTTRFKAGDAITRTIRRQATGVPALGMAEFRFTAPDGVRVYVDPPKIEDRSNRGIVDGERVDKATYVFERGGSYVLPDLSQPWWSLADKRARVESLPGLTISVASPASHPAGGARAPRLGLFAAVTAAVVLLVLALVLIRRRLVAAWHGWQQRQQDSEAFARKTLIREAQAGDPAATYRALGVWLERLPPAERQRTRADPRLSPFIAELESALFGGGSGWEPQKGEALARAVSTFSQQADAPETARAPLPPLNPVYPA